MRSSFIIFLVAPRTRPTKGGSIAVALGTLAFGAKLYRYAVPSPKAASLRAASDAFTRPINGARPSGQHKCCSKTSRRFCPARHCLSWRPCHSPVSQLPSQYNFLRQKKMLSTRSDRKEIYSSQRTPAKQPGFTGRRRLSAPVSCAYGKHAEKNKC